MFWALQKRREELEKARREGLEEGIRLGRQAIRDERARGKSEENPETSTSAQGQEDATGASSLSRKVEVVRTAAFQKPGLHRFGGGPGYEHSGDVNSPQPYSPDIAATSFFPPFDMVDWTVSTPLGNKTVAFVPDANGRLKATLVDADPAVTPQE